MPPYCPTCLERGHEKYRDCLNPEQVVVWDENLAETGENTYYCCPIKLIPETIHEFYNIWQYEKEFNTGVPYGERVSKFIDAMDTYNRHYIEFYKIVNKQ